MEETNRDRLVDLHNIFHFGDQMSDIECAVEQRYLTQKSFKGERFAKTKNNMFRMAFTEANFRRQIGISNSVLRNVDYFDDLCQFFQVPFDLISPSS